MNNRENSEKSIIIVRDFNIPLLIIDRLISKKKMHKVRKDEQHN